MRSFCARRFFFLGKVARLFAGVHDIATDNLAGVHELVDLGELAEADNLVGGLDEAAGEKVQGLGSVLAVADVAALDGDHADDGLKDRGLEVGLGGETNADDRAVGADVLGSLLEGLLADSQEDDGLRTVAVGGGGLDLTNEVLARHEVDIGRGAQGHCVVALLVTAVNGNDVQAHSLGVLDGHVAETATSTDDGDELAGAGARLLEALVDSDTGAQDGGDTLQRHFLGDARNAVGVGDAVLLERAVDSVTREGDLFAERLIHLATEGAVQA